MNRFVVFIIAFTIVGPSIVMSDKTREEKIETPDGEITTNVKTVDPIPQEIIIANVEDVQAFNSFALQGTNFVATFLPEITDPTLKDFDKAFQLWQQNKNYFTDQQVVEILGAYLGNKLIEDFEMEWVLVNDEYGTDYAVRGKRYEVMSFPFSSVLKRIDNNQYDFMFGVYHSVRSTLESGEYKTRQHK